MKDAKKTVVIGFVGSTLDQGRKPDRWQRWRPTISLLMHEDLLVDELVLLHDRQHHNLVKSIAADAKEISPQTQVSGHKVSIKDPWDFAEVYGALYDFVKTYPFDVEKNNYLLHITTGTHVAQICWYLLVDAHYLPAQLGAAASRAGLLRSADQGILFLDEIGELGLDEQAMLLKALEDKSFFPVGSDKEIQADFQLIAGTNRDLRNEVQAGRFREDLWARLNTWTFFLPNLKDRVEDIAPNIDFELQRFAAIHQRQLRFQRDALEIYLKFAKSADASWQGNFRDLAASVTRLATLSQGELIRRDAVEKEIQRLKQLWLIQDESYNDKDADILLSYLSPEQLEQIDEFDQIQLRGVLKVCENSKSMAEAGRQLFSVSRQQRNTTNDSDRVKKYLARFGLSWNNFQ